MHPILFNFGSFTIYNWGAMLAFSLVIVTFLLYKQFVEENINPNHLLNIVVLSTIFGLFGSRLFYVFFYEWSYFSHHLIEIFCPKGGLSGLVWYGGLVGGLLAALIYILRWRLDFWHLVDLIAPYLALAYAIVRVGCFLNGCCYGKTCSLPWAVVFPAVDYLPRHPTQFYSSLINILIFGVLLYLYPRRKWNGQVFITYIILYCVYRVIVEFFRENLLLGPYLTIAQWISLVVFILSLIILIYKNRQYRNAINKE